MIVRLLAALGRLFRQPDVSWTCSTCGRARELGPETFSELETCECEAAAPAAPYADLYVGGMSNILPATAPLWPPSRPSTVRQQVAAWSVDPTWECDVGLIDAHLSGEGPKPWRSVLRVGRLRSTGQRRTTARAS